MNSVEKLTSRLHDIARFLEGDANALALLGLGSVGKEIDRLDIWSDIDFFVIVKTGTKDKYLENLDWLKQPIDLAYSFKNTKDGFKLLWEDGVFGEMAVFEPQEIEHIPFSEGKLWWAREGFDINLIRPKNSAGHRHQAESVEHCVGELMTCLYVGLCRFHRGETLSAWRFIQGYSLDKALELAEFWEEENPVHKDLYNIDRRFEERFPDMRKVLSHTLLGYNRIPESALNLLNWLESKTEVNAALASEIRKLCESKY